jgi:hypothetical protein
MTKRARKNGNEKYLMEFWEVTILAVMIWIEGERPLT